jgi:hypothetical protein
LVGASLDAAPSVPLEMSDDVARHARIGDVGCVFLGVHHSSAPIGEHLHGLHGLRGLRVLRVPHPLNDGCPVCPLQNCRALQLRL